MTRLVVSTLAAMLLLATGCPPEAEPPPPPDPCLGFFDIDAPEGDWMWARGSASSPEPDVHYRLRFVRQGDAVKAWYVHDLDRYELTGTRRETDWLFTSAPLIPADQAEAFKTGNADPDARYDVYAYLSIDKQCHVEWTDGYHTYLEGAEAEKTDGMGRKLLAPVGEQTVFSYRPCTEQLGATEGDTSLRAFKRMIDAETGAPILSGDAANLVVWTDAAADGDPACTYSFDYFWDGLIKDEKVESAKVVGDQRKWDHRISLQFLGSHDVTFERYRTCDGGEPEYIGTSCGLVQVQ